MSVKPYESPVPDSISSWGDAQPQRALAAEKLRRPANALRLVSVVSIALLGFAIFFDFYLLVSGLAQRLDRGGIDPTTRITVRLIWDTVIFAASCYVYWGAVQLKLLTKCSHARSAAIVACIPCAGPCCLLGIPFGVWAFNLLGSSEVYNSFKS
jgi:hypothetical protein